MPNRWKAKALVINKIVALGDDWRGRKRLRRVILAKTDIKTARAVKSKIMRGNGMRKGNRFGCLIAIFWLITITLGSSQAAPPDRGLASSKISADRLKQ